MSKCQDFDDDKRGDYVHEWLLGNEELADIAKKWIRSHLKNGFHANEFQLYVNTELLRSAIDKGIIKGITEWTACTWLEKLGFEYKYATKNTFVNVHERSDVVAHSKNYIKAFRELEKNKNAIFMFQDEVCYHANMCEFKQWCEKDRTQKQLLQKSQGQGDGQCIHQ